MGADDELGRAVSESDLFKKMRAKADESAESFESDWTEREAKERQELHDRLLREAFWEEDWDATKQKIFWKKVDTNGHAVETRWSPPSLSEVQAGGLKGSDPGTPRVSPREGEGCYYWVGKDGQAQGPRSLSEMRAWYQWNYLPAGTLVCPEGSTEYVDIATVGAITADAERERMTSPQPLSPGSTRPDAAPPAIGTAVLAGVQKSRARRNRAPPKRPGGRGNKATATTTSSASPVELEPERQQPAAAEAVGEEQAAPDGVEPPSAASQMAADAEVQSVVAEVRRRKKLSGERNAHQRKEEADSE